MASDELVVIRNAWPTTSIKGDPAVVSGILSLSRMADGEFLIDAMVGPHMGAPEECEHIQIVLAVEHAQALREALA